jgi:MFS family permease
MRVFGLIWFGQLISLLGSGLTNFALGVWVYQKTGSVTQFALISLFITLPFLLITPVAGTVVDRWNRRWVMLLSDSGAALATVAIALLLIAGQLEIWHIYIATSVSSIFGAFQQPAYIAATTTLVPKKNLSRATGMIQLGEAISQLISPILAGFLLLSLQLQGIILIDFATFIFSVITLLLVNIPNIKTDDSEEKQAKVSFIKEATDGWNYLADRPGLMGLLVLFAIHNFLLGFVSVLVTPLVLSLGSSADLGTVLSIGGIGMIFGSILISTWGGPQRHINGVFCFTLLSGLCILAAGLRASIPVFAFVAFLFFFSLPIIRCSSQVIFQKKVPHDLQGRVFALHGALIEASMPISFVIAGPLADKLFEPLMAANGPLAQSIGRIIGVGTGRGISLMFVLLGFSMLLATTIAYQYPRLRKVEDELPDAVQ